MSEWKSGQVILSETVDRLPTTYLGIAGEESPHDLVQVVHRSRISIRSSKH